MYSRKVNSHFVHLKNCVDDSSLPRVCTCHAKARLFPHFGHSTFTVGNVRNFCSFRPITAIESSKPFCSFRTSGTVTLAPPFTFFLKPHFGQTQTTPFPFLDTSLLPHFGQNSKTRSPCPFLFPHNRLLKTFSNNNKDSSYSFNGAVSPEAIRCATRKASGTLLRVAVLFTILLATSTPTPVTCMKIASSP